jgi:glycosyltransferase involved in cell wall biosynthesis
VLRLRDGEGPVLLAVGGVEARKNTLCILRAFVRVRALHPGARLVVVGGATVLDHGAYRRRFDAELAALPEPVRGAVHETGVVEEEDVPALFRVAGVLVYPSAHEGFGLAALEALAARCPLVASRRPPLTEFLDDSCAVLVDPDSEVDVARGVIDALAGPSGRIDAGARRATGFSWGGVARMHLDRYR